MTHEPRRPHLALVLLCPRASLQLHLDLVLLREAAAAAAAGG
jgi:hypothetical protein